MKLTYIFHSGFVLETERTLIVFDYWLDPANTLPQLMTENKHTYVLCSHFHRDHFNRQILKWRWERPYLRYTYILSKDILQHGRAEANEADVWMETGDEWSDENLRVKATGSNDYGVSWIVEVEGKTIFHAGDLNNWYARLLSEKGHRYQRGMLGFGKEVDPEYEERRYLVELEEIARIRRSFDVVLFPLDGRIGNGYTRGARQFLERFQVGLFIPMHFVASGFASAWRMKIFTDMHNVPFWKIEREGDWIEIP